MLEIKNLCAGYGGTEILHQVELSIPSGAVTVIVGPNGCGKSTLLKAIAGIHPASGGSITLHGTDLTAVSQRELARKIAYLPQNRPVPEITVERLVLHGRFPYLSYPRHYRQEDLQMAQQAMETMGIGDLAHRMLGTLSGGQRQKVYIAMTLAQNTPVVMLDEPTTFLDIAHQMQLIREAHVLARTGKAVVLVLHDLALALTQCDHLAVMHHGKILAQGNAEMVYHSGMLDTAFGVRVCRVETQDGWQYYCREC